MSLDIFFSNPFGDSCAPNLETGPNFNFLKPSCAPVYWQDIIDKPTLFPYDFNVQDTANINLNFDIPTSTLTADLIATGVVAGAYGSAVAFTNFTVDANGRLSVASTVSVFIAATSDTNSIDLDVTAQELTANLKLSAASPPAGNIQITNTIEPDGLLSYIPENAFDSFFWLLTGNSGTVAGTNFIGTTDGQDVVVKSNSAEVARFNTSKNLLVGTTSDQSYRTVVFSDATVLNGLIVRGGNLLAANYALRVQDSGTDDALVIQNDRRVGFNTATLEANTTTTMRALTNAGNDQIIAFKNLAGSVLGNIRVDSTIIAIQVGKIANPTGNMLAVLGSTIVEFQTNATSGTPTDGFFRFYNVVGSLTGTANTFPFVKMDVTWAPTSGTNEFRFLHLVPTINQTGGANGATYGIYCTPVLTSANQFTFIDYNPTITSVTTHYGVVIRPAAALNGVATSAPLSTWDNGGSTGLKITTSSAASLTLDGTASEWTFTGGSATTWTMTNVLNRTHFLNNRGTAAITLQASSGNLYTNASVATFTINPGESFRASYDGSFWKIS